MVAELQDEGVGHEELDLCCIRFRNIAFFGDSCYGIGLQNEFSIIKVPVSIALQGRIDHGRHIVGSGAATLPTSCCYGEVALQT